MEKMKEVEIRERGVGETEGGRSPTGVSPTAPLRAGDCRLRVLKHLQFLWNRLP